MKLNLGGVLILLVGVVISDIVAAEPYIAVRTGLTCMECHTNVTGGGMRTPYANRIAQRRMPRNFIKTPDKIKNWTGEISKWLSVGGDLRADYQYVDIPSEDSISESEVEEGLVYIALNLIPDRLIFYVDEQVAPERAANREIFGLFKAFDSKFYAKVGQFFLPYGWRLEDDTAFIRQVPGINFSTPDKGFEVGLETGPWSAQLAVTNGAAGGRDDHSGNQYSLMCSYVRDKWRVGAIFNFNDADIGDRQMQNIFFGLRTGPVTWLAQADYIRDESLSAGERGQWLGLVEGNWLFAKGNNLKITYEYFDPDDDVDEDEQTRWSGVWSFFPFQFTETRVGIRLYDGIPQNNRQNRDNFFAELHIYF